ncbi:MAG: PBECR2 nuclease fold domain-containing protein [Eubacteriales bacterium]|nr:PBECR2 nuclease fold domain-containing protein [Eubacteriales bacterium]
MHSVGKIDKNIYKCITYDIVTDEVIITDNQIQHIKDRHPDSYLKSIEHLKNALEDPDFIIEDKHKSTGLVVKSLDTEEGHTQIVLRVCTSEDPKGYKNSIISSWEISEKRLQNYLRNKRVLYKKE